MSHAINGGGWRRSEKYWRTGPFFFGLVFNLCEQGCEGGVILSGCEGILMILNGRRVTAVIQMSLVTATR